MLAAAHALAIDSKNLLDVVDATRLKYPHLNQKIYASYQQVVQSSNLQPSRSNSVETANNMSYVQPTPVSCTIVSYPPIETYSQSAQQSTNNTHSTSNNVTNPSQIVDS